MDELIMVIKKTGKKEEKLTKEKKKKKKKMKKKKMKKRASIQKMHNIVSENMQSWSKSII